MELADQELSRIIKLANREFQNIDWSSARQKSLESSRGSPQNYSDDTTSSYYFQDKLGINCHGDTPLHRLLAMHAPSCALQDFLYHLTTHTEQMAFEDSMSMYQELPSPTPIDLQNNKGVTPLHIAVYRNSWHVEGIVRLLLSSQDTTTNKPGLASIPMDGGSYPLHILCGQNLTIRTEVLSMLLQADPSIVKAEDRNGDNPLSLLWKNVLRFRWAVSLEQGKEDLLEYINDGVSWMTVIAPEQFIHYSLLMIQASRPNGALSSDGTITLHELCAMPRCPPLLLRLALSSKYKTLFGNRAGDVYMTDENGMLPIHHAARSVAANHRFVTPYLRKNGVKSIVEILLKAFPESATMKDNHGRLALHYALESGILHQKSLLALVRLYPEALRVQDPISGLFPFMIVASNTKTFQVPQPIQQPQQQQEPMMVDTDCTMFDEEDDDDDNKEEGWERDNVGLSYFLLLLCPEAVQYQGKTICAGASYN